MKDHKHPKKSLKKPSKSCYMQDLAFVAHKGHKMPTVKKAVNAILGTSSKTQYNFIIL